MSDVFNPTGAQNVPVKTNSELYKVSYKEGKNNIYTSWVRFIPWVADPSRCIFEKQVSYVKNPMTKQGMYIDDPRTIGEFSPVSDMFFKFYNTKNDTFVKYGKENLSSKQQYASLVQIIKDEQHPELEGQIKIFIYGKTIWEKLYYEEHPDEDHPYGSGINPFHPVNGRFFRIRCTEKSGFNNHDTSMFVDNNGNNGMYIAIGNRMEQVTANIDQNAIVDYLKTYSPDLSKYDYQPWTEEQAKFVDNCLQLASSYLNTGTIPANTGVVNGTANMQMTQQPTFPGATMSQPAVPQTPMMPQTPMQPQMPNVGMPNAGMQAPNMPAPQTGMGGFNLGGMPLQGVAPVSPIQNTGVTEPGINGINLPPTVGMQAPQAPMQQAGSIGGNIDEILNNI